MVMLSALPLLSHAESRYQQIVSRVEHLASCEPGVDRESTATSSILTLPLKSNLPVAPNGLDCFRIPFTFPFAETRGYALYLLHASPGAAVYLNGAFLGASEGFQHPPRDGWNFPLLFSLPATLLRPGANEVLIQIGTRNGINRPLDAAEIGLQSDLYPRYEQELWWRVTGVQIVCFIVGLIGLFAGVLWWRRRSEMIFLLFAASCGLWIIRNAKFAALNSFIPSPLFELLTDRSLFWLVALLFALSFQIIEARFPRLVALLFGYALVATVLLSASHSNELLYAVYVVLIAASGVFLAFLSWRFIRQRTILIFLLFLAAVVTSVTGAYDFLLQALILPPPGIYLMPYSALFYALTVGWALIDRFVRAHNDFERLNIELDSRLQAREHELSLRYKQMTELERDKAVGAERERILRDMHDGLGLQLISSMRLIEKGSLSRQETSALLSEALDEMRIAIDSVKPSAGDLLVMLGNLRYRMEPRLGAAGILLEWNIGEVGGIEALLPNQVIETARIVQEGFTNALKHSQATSMTLSVRTQDGQLEISLSDNGRGFDARALHTGEGLKNMNQRATRMGARFDVDSHPGRTEIIVRFALPQTAS